MQLNNEQESLRRQCQDIIDTIYAGYQTLCYVTPKEAEVLRAYNINGEGEKWFVLPPSAIATI